uniref:Tropomyosin n=1 Tax=Panagrolaimus davidi TaxID=227884 RepID=A0A914PAX2_9BILA
MLQMQQELESAKAEVENYKKAAEIAKKEADDFRLVLDEEKRRSNNRIADLRKQNLALCDEVEALRGGGSGDGKRQKLSDDFDEDGSAANTIKSLREQLAKAVGEIEGYRTKVKISQKETDDMKIALNAEKYARHDEVQKLKDHCDYHRYRD